MPIAEFLKDPKPATSTDVPARPVDQAAKLRKQVFIGFGAIIVVGLALAGWYVGFRVLAGERTPPPAVPAAITAAPAATPPVTESKKPTITAAATAVPPVEVAKPVEKPPAPIAAPPVPSLVEAKPTVVPKASPPVAKQLAAVPEPVQPAKAARPAKREVPATPSFPFQRRDVNPHHGDRYLQVAAYGPRALDAYLKSLEAQGRHPVVAPGPVDNIYRILIGPFPNPTALEEARHSIQASGIEPILRSY